MTIARIIQDIHAATNLLSVIAVLAAVALLSPPAHAQGSANKIGVYLPFPDDSLRGKIHEEAIKQAIATYRSDAEIFVNRGVPPADIGDRMRRLEVERFKGMLLLSSAYYNPAVSHLSKVRGQMYVSILAANTRPQKVSTFNVRMYEGFYLAGILAGRVSRDGLAGFVGGRLTSESVLNVNAFALGMRSQNPNAEVKVVFVGKSKDRAKERAAANWMMNESNVDVMTHDTDSDEVPRLATANRVWTVPVRTPDSLQPKIAESTIMRISSNWEAIYRQQIDRAMGGASEPQFRWSGMREGAVSVSDYNPALPVTHVQEVSRAAEAIKDGTLSPFAGPIIVKGKKLAEVGQVLPDERLARMNFFVDGITLLKSN